MELTELQEKIFAFVCFRHDSQGGVGVGEATTHLSVEGETDFREDKLLEEAFFELAETEYVKVLKKGVVEPVEMPDEYDPEKYDFSFEGKRFLNY